GPGLDQPSGIVDAADPPADGDGHENAVADPPDHVGHDFAGVTAGGDVVEDQLIREVAFISAGELHRVAHIAQPLEIHPFNNATLVAIEAGNDPFREQGGV